MTEIKDFTIDKVAWSSKLVGTTETLSGVVHRFWVLVNFLQEEKLTTRILAKSEDEIGEEFAIMRSDLTDLGFELIKKSIEKWSNGLDRGKKPDDLKVFKRDLEKLRNA
jgi:hypothetical protein